MSKKQLKSQASSSRAASGAFAVSSGALAGGFGAIPSSPLSYVYEPPDLSSVPEPNIIVAFKNLQKKDSTTKAKALEDLQKYVAELDPKVGVEDTVLEPWVSFVVFVRCILVVIEIDVDQSISTYLYRYRSSSPSASTSTSRRHSTYKRQAIRPMHA